MILRGKEIKCIEFSKRIFQTLSLLNILFIHQPLPRVLIFTFLQF